MVVSTGDNEVMLVAATPQKLAFYGLEPVCNHCGRRRPIERLWMEYLACNGEGPFDLICWRCNAKLAARGYGGPQFWNVTSRRNERIFDRIMERIAARAG